MPESRPSATFLRMNARSRNLLEQLQSLPLEERDEVAAELCGGVASESGDAPDPAWIAELERRTRGAKEGHTTPIAREDARARVHDALRTIG